MVYLRHVYKKLSESWISNFQPKQFKSTQNVQHIKKSTSSQRYENPFPKMNIDKTRDMKKQIDGIALLLLCIPITTFYLGAWQVKRKKWKEDLIEKLTVTTKIPAIDLPADDDGLQDLVEFRRVRVKGEFDHSGEMYLGPRSCLIDGEPTSGGLLSSTRKSGLGYYVVTPFILSESKERILINRGWVSFSGKNPGTRRNGQIEGEVELEGIIRKTEPKSKFVPPDLPEVRIFPSRNVENMATMAETKPIYLDATVESTVEGGPIGGQTRATLRNEHLSYIITWYSLSAATAFMWCRKYLLKK